MKRILISLVVLVVLIIVVAVVYSPEEQPVETPQLPAITTNDLKRIEIHRREGTGDNAKEFDIVLEKDGGEWKMTKPVEYAAKQASVERMAGHIAELEPVDVVASSSELHQEYELTDELAVHVKASGAQDTGVELLLGIMRNGHTFARKPGEDMVFRLRGMLRSAFSSSPSNYRDRTIFRLDKERIDRVKFSNENGVLEFAKTDGSWSPVGREIKNFNYRKLEGLLSSIAGLNARDFMDGKPTVEESGITPDADFVWFHLEPASKGDAGVTGPSEEHVLYLGGEHAETRTVYVRKDKNPQHFLLSKHMIERLKVKDEDFARTDEEMKKEAERNAQGAMRDLEANPLDGTKGTFIRPEFREEFKRKMQNQ